MDYYINNKVFGVRKISGKWTTRLIINFQV